MTPNLNDAEAVLSVIRRGGLGMDPLNRGEKQE